MVEECGGAGVCRRGGGGIVVGRIGDGSRCRYRHRRALHMIQGHLKVMVVVVVSLGCRCSIVLIQLVKMVKAKVITCWIR